MYVILTEETLSTTMAIETKNFLHRTEELLRLISRMEKLKTLEAFEKVELTSINEKLQNLSKLVKQDNCLNAGGKFEWIDSVLVKVNFSSKLHLVKLLFTYFTIQVLSKCLMFIFIFSTVFARWYVALDRSSKSLQSSCAR